MATSSKWEKSTVVSMHGGGCVLATGFDQYESSSISVLATDRSNGALYRLVAPGGGWNEGRAPLSPLSPLSAPKYDLNAGGIVIKLAKGATCRLQEGRP